MGSEVGDDDWKKTPNRWVGVALSLVPGNGAGHFYLGRRRRALLWVVLPLSLYVALLVAILRTPLPGLYWCFAPAIMLVMFGSRALMALDVAFLPASSFRRAPWLHVALFALAAIAFVVFVQVMVRKYVVEAYRVASGAMQPSLLPHEHVAVDKSAFRGRMPERGELAVLEHPEAARVDYIERVIALPGDRLEVVNGRLVINGWEVPRCRLGSATLDDTPPRTGDLELEFLGRSSYLIFLEDGGGEPRQGPYEVASGEVWVLGDNRNDSADSRAWADGRGAGAPLENLHGRPAFAWLTFKSNGYPDLTRVGADLAKPRLPSTLQHLDGALERCLAQRPSRTTPP